ncbi:MAG: AAA family ATPase [Deltaproteobacteria bacterium]|nr:AAA family ATPase [Deltaproteobacteria bacterium]
MPHQRARHVLPLLLKRLKLWPVLGILGARQVGKSTLLRDQLATHIEALYQTMDNKELRSQAEKRPNYFLDREVEKTLIIDEVQKAPDLFDAIKVRVDEKRRPGRFLLSGSTEFSQKTGIRESLTGRIGIFRLYPLTLAESEEKKFSNPWVSGHFSSPAVPFKNLQRRMHQGGMPGICFLRSEEERRAAFDSWLETTCYRDIQQIRGAKISGDLAMEILSILPQLEEPTLAEISLALRVDSRKIKNHLDALESVFVLNRLNAHRLGTGKAQYYLFDSGLCYHLGGSPRLLLKTWLFNECLAQFEYSGVKVKVCHYRSSRKSSIDWVLERERQRSAYILTEEQAPGTYVFRAAEAFLKKAPQTKVFVLAPVDKPYPETKNIQVLPYGGLG